MRIRYGRWSGTIDPFPTDVSPDDVLDELSEDLLEGMTPEQALDRLMRRGMRGRVRGLEELRRMVAAARQREAQRMGVEEPLRQAAERLGEILERERTALQFSAHEETAGLKQQQLADLPPDVASRLSELEHYDWEDARAGQEFRDLVESLRRDVAQAAFGRLAQALGSMSAEDLARSRDLLAELNGLAERQARGEDVQADFEAFKERYRDALGELADAETLDDLLEELARRMAAMSQLLASMSPEQREQLAQLSQQLLGDADLAFQAEQLGRALQSRFPQMGWGEPVEGAQPTGQESGSLSQAVDWVEHLQSYEDLGQALGQEYPGARMDDIDEDAVRRALGEEGVRDLRALKEMERALEEAGALQREGGRMKLTSRGIRRLGEKSLARIFARALDGSGGSHRTPASGGDGELTGSTRAWQFGDPFRLDVSRTIGNAVMRGAHERAAVPSGASRTRVRMMPVDFELAEAERRVRAATVLLLDMSFSMPLAGQLGSGQARRPRTAVADLVEVPRGPVLRGGLQRLRAAPAAP